MKQVKRSIAIDETFTIGFLIVCVVSNIIGIVLGLITVVGDYLLSDRMNSANEAIEQIRTNWYIEIFSTIGLTGLIIGLFLSIKLDKIKYNDALTKRQQ